MTHNYNYETIEELSDLEKEVKLPYVLKNKVLFGPGIWNNNIYSESEIKEAFQRTNWDSKEVCSLFLDHLDESVPDWTGLVKNPKLKSDGNIIGDLHIVDKPTAIKLHYGAKFGISPKVAGLETNKGSMKSFSFANWSIVITPACKLTYINNNQINLIKNNDKQMEEINMDKEMEQALEEATEVPDRSETIEEVKVESEEPVEEEVDEPVEESEEEAVEEDESVEALMEKLSGEELSKFTEFMVKLKNDGKKLSEIAKSWKAKETLKESYKSMSQEELSEIVNICNSLLNESKQESKPEVDINKLKEDLKKEVINELNQKKPKMADRATMKVQELSQKTSPKFSNSCEGMMEFMKVRGSGEFSL